MIKTNHYNINQEVKSLNDCILKAAKETIPRGARKNYRPYWTAELQEMEDTVETARVDAEQRPTVQNNVHLKASEVKCKKAYIQAARSSWGEKTNELNMDRDGKKMWNVIRAMNDESKQSASIVIKKMNRCTQVGEQQTASLMTTKRQVLSRYRTLEDTKSMMKLKDCRERNLAPNIWNNLSI